MGADGLWPRSGVLRDALAVGPVAARFAFQRLKLRAQLGLMRFHLFHHGLHLRAHGTAHGLQVLLVMPRHLVEIAPDFCHRIAGKFAVEGSLPGGVLIQGAGERRHALVVGHGQQVVRLLHHCGPVMALLLMLLRRRLAWRIALGGRPLPAVLLVLREGGATNETQCDQRRPYSHCVKVKFHKRSFLCLLCSACLSVLKSKCRSVAGKLFFMVVMSGGGRLLYASLAHAFHHLFVFLRREDADEIHHSLE
jgi:hypothetical protein